MAVTKTETVENRKVQAVLFQRAGEGAIPAGYAIVSHHFRAGVLKGYPE